MNALIVDDEVDIGLMMTLFLKKQNISSDHVTLIAEAKEKIKTGYYDIFFLDLNLPDGTGFDLVADIREKVSNPFIVVISAYDGVDEMSKMKAFEIDAFVKKPFSKEDIINSLPTK